MNIYISGICGTGLGPLALMAADAGLKVYGSDLAEGAVSRELAEKGIPVEVGPYAQNSDYLNRLIKNPGIDWLVYTSALPDTHKELKRAREMGIRYSKRDELISYLVDKLDLKMIAVAGTHGKTTTTSMIVWACQQLDLPISYLVGTTLPFAESGHYAPDSQFLIYEADEYDRNFLHFSPWLSVITSIDYDHPDTYPTHQSYRQAFLKFMGQSERVINPTSVRIPPESFHLAGLLRRQDAALAAEAVQSLAEELGRDIAPTRLVEILDAFPGAGRRFERLSEGVYSDYGHHPAEIAATLSMAQEEASRRNLPGVVAVYQPHQNVRQHQVRGDYRDAFAAANHIFWLPTYLVREDPSLPILTPEELISGLQNAADAEPAQLDDYLSRALREWRSQGYLIILLTAGPADAWLRSNLTIIEAKKGAK